MLGLCRKSLRAEMVLFTSIGQVPTPLRGVLLKKHRRSHLAISWGRRFFEVDDERGILYYFHTRASQDWEDARGDISLAGLISVRAIDVYAGPHAFEIRHRRTSAEAVEAGVPFGSTLKLLLRASSKAEQQRWIHGLQARIGDDQQGGGAHEAAASSQTIFPLASSSARIAPPAPSSSPSPVTTAQRHSPATSVVTSAIESATLAATRAAVRAASVAAAAQICVAMGATELAESASIRRGSDRHQQVDLSTFLLQRQQEVWAELASQGGLEDELLPEVFVPLPDSDEDHSPKSPTDCSLGAIALSDAATSQLRHLRQLHALALSDAARRFAGSGCCRCIPRPPEPRSPMSHPRSPRQHPLPSSPVDARDVAPTKLTKLTPVQLQLQMMIAMGATPVTAQGFKGSSRAAAVLFEHSPKESDLIYAAFS